MEKRGIFLILIVVLVLSTPVMAFSANDFFGEIFKILFNEEESIYFGPTGTPPLISWVSPTPSHGEMLDRDNVYLNATITDATNTSAFFDWNRSLVGYWSMDYYDSSGIFDNSTYNNFGTFGGNLSTSNITTGKYGYGLEFDGISDYINLGNVPSLYETPHNQWTIEAWAYPVDLSGPTLGTNVIVRKHGGGNGYFLRNNNGKIDSLFNFEGGYQTLKQGDFTLDEWQHVVALYDGDYIRNYKNGEEVGNKYVGDTLSFETSNSVVIGKVHPTGSIEFWNGTLDEVRIYNRALSPEEINASFNNGVYRLYHNFTNLLNSFYNYSAYAINEGGDLAISNRNVTVNSTNYFPSVTVSLLNATSVNNYTIDDLMCYFTVTDSDEGDSLFANYTWYKDSVVNKTGQVSVINYTLANITLNSAYTTTGETWSCNITPYDEVVYGDSEVSSDLMIELKQNVTCGDVIDIPGFYFVGSNASDYSLGHCIVLESSDVYLNCQNNTLDASSSTPYDALRLIGNPEEGLSNVTIVDCNINDFTNTFFIGYVNNSLFENIVSGKSTRMFSLYYSNNNSFYDSVSNDSIISVFFDYSDSNKIENVNISSLFTIYKCNYADGNFVNMSYVSLSDIILETSVFDMYGCNYNNFSNIYAESAERVFYGVYSENNKFYNSNFTGNGGENSSIFMTPSPSSNNNHFYNNWFDYFYYLVHVDYTASSQDNIFYNNFFNVSEEIYGTTANIQEIWNIEKTSGINIMEGSWLGGNFWANPTGTGFSQTCVDSDEDGICDSIYLINQWDNNDSFPLFSSEYSNYLPNVTTPSLNSSSMNNYTTDNLICTFTVSDPDSENNLYANYTWYKDSVVNKTGQVSVNNGQEQILILDSYYTAEGEIWNCNITPYDEVVYGDSEVSNDLEIMPTPPRIIWEDPTPVDGEVINEVGHNYVYLNATVEDDSNTSAFFDWNRSLIGYWSMDYYNSSGIFDNSTHDNYCSYQNDLGQNNIVSGKYGNSLIINESRWIEANNTDELELDGEDFTIDLWYYQYTGGGGDIIAKYAYETAVATEYTFLLSTNLFGWIQFFVKQQGGGSSVDGTNLVNENEWYHVVAYYNSSSRETGLYINGTLVSTDSLTADAIHGDQVLRMGAGRRKGGAGQRFFSGMVDEVKIHSRVLSPEEINASFNNGIYRLYHNFTDLLYTTYDYSAYAIDTYGDLTISNRNVTINTTAMGISISLSPELADQIMWNITYLPTYNQSASGNEGTLSRIPVTLNVSLICGGASCSDVNKDVPLKNYIQNTLGHDIDTYMSIDQTWDPTDYDVVVISSSVYADTSSWLKEEAVGILTLDGHSYDDFGLASGGQSSNGGDTNVSILNNTHYITRVFSLGGPLELTNVSTNLAYMSGISNDVKSLAKYYSNPLIKLLYVDKDGTLYDESTAAERRVFFGASYFNDLTENGTIIFDRAFDYAAYLDSPEYYFNTTSYYINVSSYISGVDIYIKGSGDLMTSTLDVLGLGNETFSYNYTNGSFVEGNKYALTTNFSDNKIGDDMQNGSTIFLKFFLTAPPMQPAGRYNNSLFIKAVPSGFEP